MKYLGKFVALVILLTNFTVTGDELPDTGPESEIAGRIALVDINESLEKDLITRLEKYAERELRVETKLIQHNVDPERPTLEKLAEEVAENLDTSLYPVIIAFSDLAKENRHIFRTESKKIAVVNIAPLECKDKNRFAMRLERLMMRSAGIGVGLGFDPDPHCVMHSYETIEDLDRMGRNFSPPWQALFLKSAKQQGLKIIPHRRLKP